MMKVMTAEKIWCRSEAMLRFCYTVMTSYGNSKSYNHLMSLNGYGDQHPIVKEICVKHIVKRLGVGLRKNVTESTAKFESLKGKGKLTQTKLPISRIL